MMIYENFKKSKPKKLTAAQRKLAEEWEAIVNKYAPKKPLVRVKQVAKTVYVRTVDTSNVSRLNEWITGPVSSKQIPQYTGDKMIGIGTLHKSNAVPIFSQEEAIDQAKMRRG